MSTVNFRFTNSKNDVFADIGLFVRFSLFWFEEHSPKDCLLVLKLTRDLKYDSYIRTKLVTSHHHRADTKLSLALIKRFSLNEAPNLERFWRLKLTLDSKWGSGFVYSIHS